jgi:adenylylsulfate kinase
MSWAIWLTGPPASGKTTVARALGELAASKGIRFLHLESDEVRRILTPEPTYGRDERDRFYRELADLAALFVGQGFPVLIDATAPRRAYRERARKRIASFAEVFIDAPLEVREGRDPKGLYRKARGGAAPHLPGMGEPYEFPDRPELTLSGTAPAEENARRILEWIEKVEDLDPGGRR